MDDIESVTLLLENVRAGDDSASHRLLEYVYDDLRSMARRLQHRRRSDRTLNPTGLVHEAWLKLHGGIDALQNRSHFFAIAAVAMRQVIADQARSAARVKRGGNAMRVTLHDDPSTDARRVIDLLVLNDALARLDELNPRHARVVEYRIFGLLTFAEIGDLLGVSTSTARNDWEAARLWLWSELIEPGA